MSDDFKDFNKLVSKANKRYKRLSEKGWKTGAYKKAVATGGKFHNRRNASYKEKAREYQRVKNFLGSQTSTVRGSKKVMKDMLHRTGLSDIVGDDTEKIMTTEEKEGSNGSTTVINKFFDVASMVDEYLQQNRGVKVSSDEIWRSVHDTYLSGYEIDDDVDPDEIVGNVVRQLHEKYLETHKGGSSRKTWSTI